jgi:flagellar assembly protein FliH
MLSRIIEKSDGECPAEAFQLERIAHVPRPAATSTSADAADLARRVAQLEKALAETEAAAYAKGRRDAEADAEQRISAAMQNTAERLSNSVKQLADLRPRMIKEAEADLLRLALAIAQRILHRQLAIDTTALEALVKVSLDRLGRQEQIRARVHPALVDPIRAVLARLASRAIEVAADANLETGSLIFETNRGQLDASINSQLDEIERGLIDRLENRSGGPAR